MITLSHNHPPLSPTNTYPRWRKSLPEVDLHLRLPHTPGILVKREVGAHIPTDIPVAPPLILITHQKRTRAKNASPVLLTTSPPHIPVIPLRLLPVMPIIPFQIPHQRKFSVVHHLVDESYPQPNPNLSFLTLHVQLTQNSSQAFVLTKLCHLLLLIIQ